MEATLREASAADAGAIARLTGQLGYAATPEQASRRLEDVLSDHEHAVFVAENRDGAVVGWVHVFVANRLMADPFAEVGGLVVDEAHRGKGVGRALLNQAERWAVLGGFSAMRIRSNVVREGARAFYERLGYHLQKQQNAFFKAMPEKDEPTAQVADRPP